VRRSLFVSIVLLLALFPATALAADPRSGGDVTIAPSETVSDDLYLAGGTINVQGNVQGDVVAGGGTVYVTGNVTGDVITGGGTVVISGQVGRSVRAAGGSVSVNGPVGGDVVFTGGNLSLGPNSRVGRDLLVGAGSVTLDGQVVRNVYSGSGNLTIDGSVGGNVRSNSGTVGLGSSAVVNGSVSYTSDQAAAIATGAQVRGGVVRSAPPQATSNSGVNPVVTAIGDWLRAIVGLFAAGLLFILLFPGVSRRTVDGLHASPWASLGIGFALLIAVPVVAILAIVVGAFVGGWWVGLVVLAAYGIAIALSVPIAGLSLGDWILGRAGRGSVHAVWAMLLGVVVLMLVSVVPVLGAIVLFLALLFGLGALAIGSARGPRTPSVATMRSAPSTSTDAEAAA
jgi:cytoskeletal protein CcmA (bactofilin family)